MQIKKTVTQMLAELGTLIATDGVYHAPKMILVTNTLPIDPGLALADMVQPTFTGYAVSSALTWNTPKVDANGSAVVVSNPKEFKVTTAGAEQIVTAVGLVNAAGDTLLATMELPEPLHFATLNDIYLISWPLTESQPLATDVEVIG